MLLLEVHSVKIMMLHIFPMLSMLQNPWSQSVYRDSEEGMIAKKWRLR